MPDWHAYPKGRTNVRPNESPGKRSIPLITVEERLAQAGLALPRPNKPGKIDLVKICGETIYVSGHGPTDDCGRPLYRGRVGRDLTLAEAKEAAKLVALNCLASLKETLGTLDRVQEIIKVLGFVNSDDNFHDQPEVMHGFTDVMLAAFGEAGRHTRSAIGTSNLPNNIPVEVEMIARLRS